MNSGTVSEDRKGDTNVQFPGKMKGKVKKAEKNAQAFKNNKEAASFDDLVD